MSAAGNALVRQLLAKAGEGCEVQARSTPWFSVTFAGERHEIVLALRDQAAVDRLLCNLDAYEFAVPRATVAEVVAVRGGDDGRRVDVEALTIDE